MDTTYFLRHELEHITGGAWHSAIPLSRGFSISTVSIDSRNLQNNSLFLALRGIKHDGHDFIISAIHSTSIKAICAEVLSLEQTAFLQEKKIPCLLVNNTQTAYQDLAHAYRMKREKFCTFIGITGSSGKTTTKDILATILNLHFNGKTLCTRGNTNNQIGVPLNLFRLRESHLAAVLEIGTNTPGEIELLTGLVRPHIAILTTASPSHLQGFGTLEAVMREKANIFSLLRENGGKAILPYSLYQLPFFRSFLDGIAVTTFGTEKEADISINYRGGNLQHSRFILQYRESHKVLDIQWKVPGSHLAQNAGAAVAVANEMGVSDSIIQKALSSCQLQPMRMEIQQKKNICWINDAYNANPESMKAFILWLASLKKEKKKHYYLILGDMLELGEKEIKYHREILDFASQHISDMTILVVGQRMQQAVTKDISAFQNTDKAWEWLKKHLHPGDVVGLKGSRGMKLENIIHGI